MYRYLANILAFIGGGAGSTTGGSTGVTDPFTVYTQKLSDIIKMLLTPIFSVLATVGIVWVIVLSVNYMKAESTDKKEEAKKRIINVVIGTVIMIVMVVLMLLVTSGNNLTNLITWITGGQNTTSK